jgi:acyl-CoA dehydrogenase
MLMESLATGRAISLPSVACAGGKLARAWRAYALVREQFDTPIGRFEGVQERLARIAGLTYAIDAARALTLAAVDAGEQPAVASAIVKTYCTEAMRVVVNDAMDVLAGAAIMRGPRNALAALTRRSPIGISPSRARTSSRAR